VLDASALSFAFFDHFREFEGIVVHMASESYGRRYIPLFTAAVHDLGVRLRVLAGFDAVGHSSGITVRAPAGASMRTMLTRPAARGRQRAPSPMGDDSASDFNRQ
jgi:carboxypeptidase C (cathepsin A)